jgi:GT2 family glycosyltransferase
MRRPAVIIPVRNRLELTLACLERLELNGDLHTHEVLVVDDGSTDGTGAMIARRHPEVAVRQAGGDLYWGGAIAMGMEELLRPGPRTIFWLNDDCLPQAGALETMDRILAEDPGSIAVPRCIDAMSREPWPNGFIGRQRVTGQVGVRRTLDGASGYCAGVGAAVSAALGPVDAKRFPHYYADSAYTLRAARAGFRVVLHGDATVELVRPGRPSHQIGEKIVRTESLRENSRRVFAAVNSPFRLGTLFAFQRLKRGPLLGTLLAAVRTTSWTLQLLNAHLRRTRKADASTGPLE